VSRRLAALAGAGAVALVLPAAAFAHAALLRTFPAASVTVNTPPDHVGLVYSEAVEPRFAIVKVTDAAGEDQTAGPPQRSSANPNELDVPLRHLKEGWYLVFWRVISVDGHPVRGAFTFAVGPNPGPAPQFAIPSLSETAATPRLVAARWLAFISLMSSIGLLALRLVIARPLRSLPRALTIAFWVTVAVTLVATPVYVLFATAQFALRDWWSLSVLVPLMRTSAFGRGYLDLELVLVLYACAAGLALWIDRPERPKRSIAELFAVAGAGLAAGAALVAPGAAGHAAQTSPRALALVLDWVHLAAGSLWVGGLIGLLVLWLALSADRRLPGLSVVVPRFSKVAFWSVAALLASGIWASVLHLPTLASLWQTSYGKAILVKAGLLLAAMLVASVNLLRTKPALAGARPSPRAATLLRRLVSVEVLLVASAIATAAVLSSLPPPPKALAAIGGSTVHAGPGPVTKVVETDGYRLQLGVTPNKAAVPNTFSARITRGGKPVSGADVTATFTMLDMDMPTQTYRLSEKKPGTYAHTAPALVMVGHWGVSFSFARPGGEPFTVVVVDKAGG